MNEQQQKNRKAPRGEPTRAAVAKRIAKRAPQHNPDILDRVMVIYMQIAISLDREIEESVAGETLEHVIEERNAGLRLAASGTVELERDRHRSLAGLALNLGATLRLGRRQSRNGSGGLSHVS